MIEKKVFFAKGKTKQRLGYVFFYVVLIGLIVYLPATVWKMIFTGRREISVFSFSDVIPECLFRRFEKATGIKVNNKYCDSDAEIWSQLYINSGGGYDLVTPTSNMIQTMKSGDLIRSFSFDSGQSQMTNERIDKRFKLENPSEVYSVPFAWSVHGIGFRKKFFIRRGLHCPDSWSFVFERPDWIGFSEPLKKYGVCLSDDPLDIVFVANLYLTGDVENFSSKNISRIVKLLTRQKRIVRAYANSNVVYYLQHISPIVLAISAHMKIPLEQHEDTIGFIVPKEGGLLSVQHFAIPKNAKNVDLAIEFINFMLKDENSAQMFKSGGFFPVTTGALDEVAKVDLDIVREVLKSNKPLKALNSKLGLAEAYKIFMSVKS